MFYHYLGAGRPDRELEMDDLFRIPGLTIIDMGDPIPDLLYALQLVHGVELRMISFQEYHDKGWENQKQTSLNQHMYNVACSVTHLTDLMMSPHGDLRWKRELETRQRYEQRIRCTSPQGFFI